MTLVHQRRSVLVTGASGFVGSALVPHLLKGNQYDVRSASRTPLQSPSGVKTFTIGEISRNTDWRSSLQDANLVVHLAARVHVMRESSANPLAEFRRVNVDGTLALAEQAAGMGVARFVFLSSVKVNGETGTFSESDEPLPLDDYGCSKLEAENGLTELAARTGMEVVIIRPPLVYGPGVKANFRLLLRLVERGLPLPFGSVHNKRSYVAVDNLVSLIAATLQHAAAANETFFVSDGHDLSTPELIRAMAQALGRRARLLSIPEGLLRTAAAVSGTRAVAQRLLGSLQVEIKKAQQLLNWSPPVAVEEALRRVVGSV